MRHSPKIAIGIIVLGYIAVRLWGLTESCLWFDEIFSVHAAEMPWNELLRFVALDLIHPPLFYLRLKLWIDIVGDDVLWLRLLPVIISCIAIAPFLFLCRELRLRSWVTAFALFLLAVNGSLIKYAQEVRMYSLLMCLSLFSMWLFARYFNRGKGFGWLLLINVLLVYSHYFGWFVVSAEVVAILIFERAKWRRIAVMCGVVLASFLPWMIAVVQAARGGSGLGQNIGWMSRPGIREIGTFVFDVIEPFYYQASNAESESNFRVSVPILLIFLIAVVLYLANWKERAEDEKRTVFILSIFSGLPLAAGFIASWLLPYSIWGTRHLIIVFAPLTILIAVAVTSLGNTKLRVGALTLIILLIGYGFALQARRGTPEQIWCAWEKLGDDLILAPHSSPEKRRLYVFEDLVAYHFWYKLRRFENYEVRVVKGIDGVREDPAYFLPRGFDEVQRSTVSDISAKRIWIAFRGPKMDEGPGIPFIGKSLGPPVDALGKAGFAVEEVRKMEVGDQVAYLVLMLKDPRLNPKLDSPVVSPP